jgi:hypothetical protein
MANIAEVIYGMDVKDISPKILEEKMTKVLEDTDYGLKFEYCKITDFAIVKTFRLIQDQSWLSEEIDIEKKRE